MKSIYLSGKAGSGKTAVAMPIALKLKEEGFQVAYLKPQGYRKCHTKTEDDDIQFMKDVLGLSVDNQTISPVTLTQFYLCSCAEDTIESALQKADAAYNKLAKENDVVLIEGSVNPFIGGSYQMDDFSLSQRWGASMLHILRADDDYEFDTSFIYLKYAEALDLPILGCIFNNTSDAQWDVTHNIYKNMVEDAGIPVLGILPSRRSISSPTANEFLKALNGELIIGEENLDRQVENITVGTMTIESALSYLRRSPNKAVITGGDRSDMALTALETSTSVLILTGGLYPDVGVISRAEEKGVPIILVHQDTFSTVENIHSVYRTINPRNEEAIRILKKDFDQNVDFESIKKYLQKK